MHLKDLLDDDDDDDHNEWLDIISLLASDASIN